jgi:uncharacterized protein Yka (UPF0111/DUF47 family)
MIQTIIRWLMPREDRFYDYLERQSVVAHEAAKAIASCKDGVRSLTEIRDLIQDLEHKGDAIVYEMLDALAETFVTPIDREDLQRLSKRIDDILDLINRAARSCVLYGVEKPTRAMNALSDKLVDCTLVLMNAMPKLRKRAYSDLIEASRAIHRFEKDGDIVFRDAISTLFHDPAIDAKVILREKDILEDLEKAINRCDEVAETITNIAVKHA